MKPKHDYVVKYDEDKEPMAYREGRKMWKAVLIIVVLAVICSINF